MAKEKAMTEQEKNLAEKQQWWWLAEKKRSDRLNHLRKAIWQKGAKGTAYLPGVKVDLEPSILYTEAFKELEAEPLIIRRAKSMAHVWDNISIFIMDQAQIVGYRGGAPHTLYWRPDGSFLTNEDLYNDRTVIPEPEKESLHLIREIINYWNPRTHGAQISRMLSPEDVMKNMTGFIGWGAPIPLGYSTKQYGYFFAQGFNGIIEEIDQKITEAQEKLYQGVPDPEDYVYYEKLEVWNAMKMMLEAAIRYAKRYSRLAKIIAEHFETDSQRKKELLRISETCSKVPAHPPEHFWESLQFDHFIQILVRMETGEGAWPARPDYFHWPYYEKDAIQEKNLTRDEAIDLVGEFMIKAYELGSFSPILGRDTLQSITGTWVWTLGGVNEDGSDACNDLTDVFLDAALLV
ncbi:MAG: pyruvate formate lyase family protein, partial [Thermodesulfobacteriota bacterium]|nr:pyruvate formate lyase family protein [Thermodesulfobacteriota bacterium]